MYEIMNYMNTHMSALMLTFTYDYYCHLVDALKEIISTMGAVYWKFDAESCEIETVGFTQEPPSESERSIVCDCSFENNTVCHVVKMYVSSIFLKFLCYMFSLCTYK